MTHTCQQRNAVKRALTSVIPQIVVSYDVNEPARLYSGDLAKKAGLQKSIGFGRRLWDGRRIREIREDRGYSQETLADLADISKGDISRHERNDSKSNPSVDSLVRIAFALEVYPPTLLEPLGRPIPRREEFGHATVDGEGGGARIEDRLGDLLAYIKTLDGAARSDFIRAVVALLTALEHARPHAAGGSAPEDGG